VRSGQACGRRWWGGDGGEFGTDLVGVGVVEVVEDGQGLLPGLVVGVGVAAGVVGVAEVDEGGGFVVPVAEVAEQADGVLVAGDGLDVWWPRQWWA
jgi:hypothetical protein